jgi:large subunit ribosomal protein L19
LAGCTPATLLLEEHTIIMKAAIAGVNISPVNMEERKALGIKAGDTVRVHQKIQDKGKTRIQMFEGLVLARKHGDEAGATFTVRKVASGVGVERIYPLYSPMIDKLEIVKRSKVRRSKLYFIREKVAREIKRQMRRTTLTTMATESGVEAAAREAQEAAKAEEEAAKVAEAEAAKAAEEAAAAEEKAAAETPEPEATPDEATEETATEEVAPEAEAPAEEETSEEESTEEVKEEEEEKKA